MSLINQMLQDLDARSGTQGRPSQLPNDVRPLPPAPPSRRPLLLGVLTALLVGAVAAYWVSQNASSPLQTVAAPKAEAEFSPPAPRVVAAPATAPAPSTEVSTVNVPEKKSLTEDAGAKELPAQAVEAAPVADVATGKEALRGIDGSLRISDFRPAPVVEARSKSAAQAARDDKPSPQKAVEREPSARVSGQPSVVGDVPIPDRTSAPMKAAVEEPRRSAKPASIEKTDALGSPRERAEAQYRKAITAVNQGRVTEAVACLRDALEQDAYHVASRQLLVRLLLEAKRADEAMQILQDGLQGQPAQLGWAMSLARLQVERNDLGGAWQTLDHSLPAAGSSPDYQGFAGHVLQRLGRNAEAAERYTVAARLAPRDGRWWLGLGLAYDAEGRVNEAREAFQRARQSGSLSADLMALVEQKLR
ncbi:tetratricopeptide repeat protein [Propionivibrio soli]|uniref:tetratricopeptide repeat protein n=1 Tax=Propionivibrio soli TaxID=2976531 RepID=UPI0021E84B74|nr:tetratricopeptide repeat protein [Propionivibrio soli]